MLLKGKLACHRNGTSIQASLIKHMTWHY